MRVKCQLYRRVRVTCACEADIHGMFGSSDHINCAHLRSLILTSKIKQTVKEAFLTQDKNVPKLRKSRSCPFRGTGNHNYCLYLRWLFEQS